MTTQWFAQGIASSFRRTVSLSLWRRRRCSSSLLGDGKGVLVGRGVGVWSLLAVTSFEVVAFLPGHDEVAMASLVVRGHDEAMEHIFGPKRQRNDGAR